MKNFERPIGERDLIKPLCLHAIGRNCPGFGAYIDFIHVAPSTSLVRVAVKIKNSKARRVVSVTSLARNL